MHSRTTSAATAATGTTYGFLDYYTNATDEEDIEETENQVANTQQMEHTHMASAYITKHETKESIVESRRDFASLKERINSGMSIKESPLPFRKSAMKQSIKNSTTDRYGFQKTNQYISTKDYNDWWNEYCPYLIRRKAKWIKFLERNGLYYEPNLVPSRFPARSEEMARFVRKGIPAEWRGRAWFSFVGGVEKMKDNKGLYEALVNESTDLVNENTEAIEKDLHRTFPDNVYFKEQNSSMLDTLRRVLKCFSMFKPSIGYCQSLNFIAGLLLLFMNEEETFWMLVIVTEKFLPGVHESNLEGLSVNQGMLMLCLKQYLPDVWKIIMDNDDLGDIPDDDTSYLFFLPTLTFCTTSWFMSLFIGVLPIETTLRIWDIIFYHNSKTIFQVSLGIFKMLDPELRKFYCRAHGISTLFTHSDTDLTLKSTRLQENNRDVLGSDLFQLIQNTPKRVINTNLFIDTYVQNTFTQEEIRRCREFVVQSRQRHANLIDRRKELGMTHEERKELLKQERGVISGVWEERRMRTGLWNVGLNRRIKKIYSKGPPPK